MEVILHFFTGTLNTVAWMYILLPCVALGGATTSLDVAWNFATFNGPMAIPNFIALFVLSGEVAKLTKEHFTKTSHKLK